MNVLERLAIFLRDYGPFADRAIMMLVAAYLFRGWRKEAREKFELAMTLAPIAGRLTDMIERAAVRKAKRTTPTSPPKKEDDP